MSRLTEAVRTHVEGLPSDLLPAYVYDLDHLRTHVNAVRRALPEGVELYYAAKANPEPAVLAAVGATVDGFDVSSGGELTHVRQHLPHAPLAFSGPGKSPAELAQALEAGTERFHVESRHELAVLETLAEQTGRTARVLLRVNLPVPARLLGGVPLAMGGRPTPFGLDPRQVGQVLGRRRTRPHLLVPVVGVHAHLASGLEAGAQVAVAERVLAWAEGAFSRNGLTLHEVNLGGGMAVDYGDPDSRYDWAAYGVGLDRLGSAHPGVRIRIEPGRALTAYSGWYVTEVLDVKSSQGEDFAVVRGGTHHLRTPAARSHDQPGTLLRVPAWPHRWQRPGTAASRVHLVGQLCTPKDVLARDFPTPHGVGAGDRVVLAMAGAYAWNISHRDFLMHPPPTLHCLGATPTPARPSAGRRHATP